MPYAFTDGIGGITSTFTLAAPELARATTVELKAGWVGQVVVRGRIVHERHGFKSHDKALKWARKHIDARIAALFA